jgi:cytochrome o ubiquinol oxidase subunit 2
MPVKLSIPLVVASVLGAIALIWWYLQDKTVALFEPAGIVALQEHRLFMFAVVLSLVGLVPVFLMAIFFSFRYRADRKETYTPDWKYNKWLSGAWLFVVIAIIGTLGIVSWQTTHKLDPYRPLDTDIKPLTVQVVALQWKWLFIYPEQGVATVNYLNIPTKTPVNFQITADAPMNSFWIPQLAGQAYAMEGMVTKLHVMADEPGTFHGASAEISGEGFAAMRFKTTAMNKSDFDQWISQSRQATETLDTATYENLAKPGEEAKPLTYASYQPGLYDTIVMKYMSEPDMQKMTHPMTDADTEEAI